MKKRILVLSLGGSLIVSDSVQNDFLLRLRLLLKRYYSKYQFVLVCGGGAIAREYIQILKKEGKSEKEMSLAGIRATRMNAQFVMQVFGKDANSTLPKTMMDVKHDLYKKKVVICGSLRYAKKETSDGTAAKIASYIKSEFVNVTNVPGLYTDDPRTHKDAKQIPYATWSEFLKKAESLTYKPGQHFVLDQAAALLIKKKKIKTYIIGQDLHNFEKLLAGKKFIGTTIGP